MENLYSRAITIQYHYEEDLDETTTDAELKKVATEATRIEFPALDEHFIDKVADIVVSLYGAV